MTQPDSRHLVDPQLLPMLEAFPTVAITAEMLPAMRARPPWFPVSPDDIARLLREANPEERALVLLGAHGGLTGPEVRGLTLEDIDFAHGTLHVSGRTVQATEAERVRTRTLSAEWARLNDQDRLQRLATTHLQELQPTTPQQFLRVADARRRLPQATPFAGGGSAFRVRADAPVVPGEVLVFSARTMLADAAALPRGHEAAAPAPALAPAGLAPAARPSAAAPLATAPRATSPLATSTLATSTRASAPEAAPREARPAAPRAAEARPTPPRPAPTALAEARPLPAPRAADPSLRTALHVRPPEAAPQGRSVSASLAPPMGFGGSVLGGGGALPPPMPFGR
jgi:hypothetical protein